MAYTTIVFKNPNTGIIKKAPVGFSWTTLLFCMWPAIFRGDWKWGIIQIPLYIFTFGISQFIFAFIYNKLYLKDLIKNGFIAQSIESGNMDSASTKLGILIPQAKNI